MAFVNEFGKSIRYDCTDLIEELRKDIEEFGGHTIVNVWCREHDGVILYVNYDFICEENPINKSELIDNELIKRMTMTALLAVLEKQNEIF